MTTPRQAERFVSVHSTLGTDQLLFRHLHAQEELSRPFEFQLELFSENSGIAFADLLGQPMSVKLELGDGSHRYLHGLVSQFRQSHSRGRYAVYQATLRPWLWFLSQSADCRIHQNLSVPDIVKLVFREHGFTDFDDRLTESYASRDYCVQYRESTLAFVSRLLEEEGIYRSYAVDWFGVQRRLNSALDGDRQYMVGKYHAPAQSL